MSSLAEHVEAEACPHLAVFLRSPDELPGVLVSFFALGARRGGWLAHRALPGHADRERALLTEAGLDARIRPHQLLHAFGSNAVDAGAGIDVVADLLGHVSVASSQVYLHPDSSRLRAAVDAVPSPRELGAVTR